MANDNQEFDFIKEKIKRRPMDKKRLLKRLGGLAIAGIVFGLAAGCTIAAVLPWATERFAPEEEPELVKIPGTDETEELETEEPGQGETEEPETEPAETVETQSEEEDQLTKEEAEELFGDMVLSKDFEVKDYKKIYNQLNQIANDAMQAMVTVTGLHTDVDIFDQPQDTAHEGSGLIVAESAKELFVLTENGIISNAHSIRVTFADGTSVAAEYRNHDENTGIAVVKLPLDEIEEATRKVIVTDALSNTASVSRGEPVIAIGAPKGYTTSGLAGIVTDESTTFLSAQFSGGTGRTTYDVDYATLNTDILGNSDGNGVLINLDGQVVGVINQKFTSDSGNGLVSALGINQIKSLIEDLSNGKDQPHLGIVGMDITEEMAEERDIPIGLYISEVKMDSPAYDAGIQNGDILVSIDGEEVSNLLDFKNLLSGYEPNDEIAVIIKRRGAEGYEDIDFYPVLNVLK